MRRLTAMLTAALTLVLAFAGPVSADERPIVLGFEKAWAATDYYVGTVDGGGTIEMWLSNKSVIGNTQHFDATVEVNRLSGSFTAFVSGQINFSTGRVVLNGTVTSGWQAGAQVQESSQLLDPAIGSFEGTIRIMPGS